MTFKEWLTKSGGPDVVFGYIREGDEIAAAEIGYKAGLQARRSDAEKLQEIVAATLAAELRQRLPSSTFQDVTNYVTAEELAKAAIEAVQETTDEQA